MFVPCVSDHYSRSTYTPFVASQPRTHHFLYPTLGGLGRFVGKKGEDGEFVDYMCSDVGASVVGALVLTKYDDLIIMNVPLLIP